MSAAKIHRVTTFRRLKMINTAYVRFVKIQKAVELTGFSEDAIRTKIGSGVWPEDFVWKWSPDGVQLVDLEGYNKWAQMPGRASKRGRRKAA